MTSHIEPKRIRSICLKMLNSSYVRGFFIYLIIKFIKNIYLYLCNMYLYK